jgi:hypothetical protein
MRGWAIASKMILGVTTATLALTSLTPARADSGILYAIRDTGELTFYHNRSLTATPEWNPSGAQVGCGWEGFQRVFSGGDGVIYAIRHDGALLHFKDFARNGTNGDCGQQGWVSPTVIGGGWQNFRHVFSGGEGMIFAITAAGDMLFYQHLGGRNWAATSGRRIGSGWQNFRHVLSGGGGVIYGVNPNGDLVYYRYVPGEGSFVSYSGATIGNGWNNFRSIFGGGDGVIYGIRENGDLLWYKDLRRDGTNVRLDGWHPQSGTQIGAGWVFKFVIAD